MKSYRFGFETRACQSFIVETDLFEDISVKVIENQARVGELNIPCRLSSGGIPDLTQALHDNLFRMTLCMVPVRIGDIFVLYK